MKNTHHVSLAIMALFFSLVALFFNIKPSHAGINSTTAHSRAACLGINESITWWLFNPHYWRIQAWHISPEGEIHYLNTGMSYTWRQAAIHWSEAYNKGWRVHGEHFYQDTNGKERYDTTTDVTDCSIYNGWWDYK